MLNKTLKAGYSHSSSDKMGDKIHWNQTRCAVVKVCAFTRHLDMKKMPLPSTAQENMLPFEVNLPSQESKRPKFYF
jgi:hypothetical protein